jgi:hypothetical protein
MKQTNEKEENNKSGINSENAILRNVVGEIWCCSKRADRTYYCIQRKEESSIQGIRESRM